MGSFERRLELPAVVAISLSTMLGSGIFVLPGLAAAKTGPSVWLAYLAAGLCVLPAALSKAELGTAMPTSGGTYVYIDRAFGPFAGTIAGIGLWLSLLLKSSFALVGFSAYLIILADLPPRETGLALLGAITLLNIVGVIRVSQLQIVVVTVALVALGAVFIGGLVQYEPHRMETMFPKGTGGFLAATAFVFVSYAGVTKVAAIAEEIRRPERNLPLGMLVSLGMVMLIYAGVTLIIVANVPIDVLSTDIRPVYTVTEELFGHGVGIAAAVLGVVTMTSMANAGLLAASRFPFAMSREDLLPRGLSLLHARYRTPIMSILLSAGVMAAAIILFDVEKIAKLASAFVIILFVTENLTVIVLRETGVKWYAPTYRSPLYPWMQLFGVLSGIVLLVVLGPMAIAATVAIAVPGALLFVAYGRHRTERLGVVGQRSRRTDLLRREKTEPSETAAVVVALFGNERSPEMLVELADGLAEGRAIQVVHITELPEQTAIERAVEEPIVASIRRRVTAMAEEQSLELEFHSMFSRDVIDTVNALTRQVGCDWLIVEWGGRQRFAFTIRDPLGWLADHLACNLAVFYDSGVRYIRRILVHAEPGPHDALVLGTADHLAAVHGAALTFTRVIAPDSTEAHAQSITAYLEQVSQICESPSGELVLYSRDPAASIGQQSASFDLVVTGGAPRGTFWHRIARTGLDRLTERAVCSVLRLKAPPTGAHASFERYRPRSEQAEGDVLDTLNPHCVGPGLEPMKKEPLFRHFAEQFATALDVPVEEIVESLWERERTQNTALGHGIALPHATTDAAEQTHLGVFTTRTPVDYQAPDGQPVDVFFVTLGAPADRQTHLLLLSSIAKLVMSTNLLDRLREAGDRDEILAAIRACSQQLD